MTLGNGGPGSGNAAAVRHDSAEVFRCAIGAPTSGSGHDNAQITGCGALRCEFDLPAMRRGRLESRQLAESETRHLGPRIEPGHGCWEFCIEVILGFAAVSACA